MFNVVQARYHNTTDDGKILRLIKLCTFYLGGVGYWD